ncbi:MAG: asparaginase domain-containing protein [Candidatus Micrarchaeota archaeon]
MKNKGEVIHFIITGGTIDSHFDPAKDAVIIGERTYVEEYIRKLQLHNEIKFSIVFLKDSREIRHRDRQKLVDEVKRSPYKRIVITHGTYTLPDSAQYLKENLLNTDKTIVFTGSMIPLKGFEFSDAPFNLGYAIASVQTLSHGIYICMNGKVFDPDKVDKNKVEGRFEENKD